MDAGIGVTYGETVRYRYEETGELFLSTSPLIVYDTYFERYYYNEWHIRVDFGKKIVLNVSFVGYGNNDTVEIFDGPWTRNNLLDNLYTMMKQDDAQHTDKVITTTGFQVGCLLKLRGL